jgi:hypothetical protein
MMTDQLISARAVIRGLYPLGGERTVQAGPDRWERIEDWLFGAQLMTEDGTDARAELEWAIDTARAMAEHARIRNRNVITHKEEQAA